MPSLPALLHPQASVLGRARRTLGVPGRAARCRDELGLLGDRVVDLVDDGADAHTLLGSELTQRLGGETQ